MTSLRINELEFGVIKEVDGNSISLHANALEREFDSQKYSAEVGAYINCGGSHGDTICIINKVQIIEIEKTRHTENGFTLLSEERKIVTLTILGSSFKGKFRRGVKRLPTINCKSFFLTSNQVNGLIGIDKKNDREHFCVTDPTDDSQTYLNLDKLMGRHVAILGTTGSGKSCTVASIVQSIMASYSHPRILFFDIHNEYPAAFGFDPLQEPALDLQNKTNRISWSDFYLPYWFLDLEEFFGVYNLEPGSNQKAILKKEITKLKNDYADASNIKDIEISADTPIFFDVDDLIINIESEKLKKNATDAKPYESILLKLKSVRNDSRYYFLHVKKDDKTNILQYFSWLLGINDNEKYLNITDLSGLPSEVRAVCVGVMSRLCFDFKFWDLDPEHLPINLVLEEAHTYIPEENDAKFNICKERVERIAKEGRKYGIGLTVVTQRPSNVSTTVLSQCGTYITLRLTNDIDQNKIRRLLPDTLSSQVDFLPSLRDGEAFISGDAINLPRKVQFKEPKPKPKSNDVRYHKYWKDGKPSTYSLASLVNAWIKKGKQSDY